jgi:hypothetical protein
MRSAGESLELTEGARPQSTLQNAKLRIRWKSARRDGRAVLKCHPEMASLRPPDFQRFLTSAEAVIRHGHIGLFRRSIDPAVSDQGQQGSGEAETG